MTDPAGDPAFLILHGFENHRPEGHWQHWLASELAAAGYRVDYPQLPDPDSPTLEQWLDELRPRLAAARREELTVVCHSLACVLWLHAVATDAVPSPVDRVLLVAPPSAPFMAGIPEVATFLPVPMDGKRLVEAARHTRLVASDNDPCCPEGVHGQFADPLDLPLDLWPGQVHLNIDAGFGSWPGIYDWCVGHTLEVKPRSEGGNPCSRWAWSSSSP